MNFPNLKPNKSSLSLMRGISNVSKSKNHYEILNVEQNATQEEIKASYYNLSKQYHPDVNKDLAAKQKFREVSEAYEILGNYKNRRQYDRGMTARGINLKTGTKDDEKDIEHMAFYKSRMRNYSRPVQTGHSKIFDFDAWTRAHYGETLKRTILRKQKNVDFKLHLENNQSFDQRQMISLYFGLSMLVLLAAVLVSRPEKYDNTFKRDRGKEER